MSFYASLLRPLLFKLPPETAHDTAMRFLTRGIIQARPFAHPILEQELFGTKFVNPLGLAAGFDKNAIGLDYWHQLGFGFVEIGTVTFHAQSGNPKPRMFRLPEDKALINRMGFNNEGAEAASVRIEAAKPKIPFGINLGKSKVVPLEAAAEDYARSYNLLHTFGSYFVVNVSSPNTPGLRELQEKGALLEIIARMREVDATRPIFVKMAPDLEMSALDEVIEVAHEAKLAGLIATNTTISREGLSSTIDEAGGLSGRPVFEKSNSFLAHLYKSCDKGMVLIGVGGIFDGQDLYKKIALGAHLCQVYTGWIYGGPQMAPNALVGLVKLMNERGILSLAELRGSEA